MHPLIAVALVSLAFGSATALVAGRVAKKAGDSRVLSRKLFHVCIFSGAVPAHLLMGFWGVVTYGTVISLIVLIALRAPSNSGLFNALARPSDGQATRRLVLAPLWATAWGGLLSSLLVGSYAVVGYLVCGWGDAVGEPAGERWGRHRYSSPLSRDRQRTRSWEGSLAVFLAGSSGAVVGLLLLSHPLPSALGVGIICGAAGALAEGLSGAGTDNLWVQLIPSLLAWRILG